MKRLLALMLSLLLLLSGTAMAQSVNTVPADNTLVVGSVTRMSGDFFAGLFSNNTADNDVRLMLHDGATVAWTGNGTYSVNANVVLNTQIVNDVVSGDATYTFTIRNDMKFSDGSSITAKDYVFSVLLLSSPELKATGAPVTTFSHLRGWETYSTGSGVFEGVRLLGPDSFSLTISGDNLPYFYELALVNVTPYPMAVIAPQCDIGDDGKGAYITGLTSALLETTLLDQTNGYCAHPSVTSGAYKLIAYDAAAGTAKFEINPYYMGTFEGQQPSIQYIVFEEVKNDEILTKLQSGELDLVNKVSNGDVITQGDTEYKAGTLGESYYLRTGMSFIAFACESRLGSSDKIRKAVALSIDLWKLCDDYLKGYGQPVFGYYGYGQWMASEQIDALEALDLYEKDINAARELIVRDGWVYAGENDPYDYGTDTLRYRALDENGTPVLDEDRALGVSKGGVYEIQLYAKSYEPLALKMAIPANNAVAKMVVNMLNESFAELGISLDVTEMPMNELLSHYYRQTSRDYDMFFLGSNFNYIFDPYYTYNTADEYQGLFNTSGLKDDKLMQLAKELREVAPNDLEAYKAKWLEFQTYWVDVLPLVPLYSNIYYDFYRSDLTNYNISATSSWASAIIYATIGAPAAGQ